MRKTRNLLFGSVFSLIGFSHLNAQVFSPERITAWENAGLTTELQAPTNVVNITDFGADNTGTTSCNTAYTDAIASLNGAAGTIFFPEGEYYFDASLTLPDSVFLKGESSSTELKFDLGGTGDLIRISGSTSAAEIPLAAGALKGTYQLSLDNASGLEAGDVIRLYMFDEDLMFSSWAYGTLGQVVEIESINGNVLTLVDPLNHLYPLGRTPYIRKLNPVRAAGIECLSIERLDASSGQTDNIFINNAYNCVIRNVMSDKCNFAHIAINSSAHILVEGSYFHHAHAYGGGGQGYGVVNQTATSFCLTENNAFEHLRHSMLIQSGANGNVYGYNYSYDPFWEDGFLPANSAGDAVLHGNYTYLNLFEGNTIQNIVVDASHGSNGPYNTFLRNRAELYGFFSDSGTPTDSMNIVGNEITNNTGWPYGLFSVNGNGAYSFGNNVNGTVTPSNTSNVVTNTLYLNESSLPDYLVSEQLPMAGYPLAMNQKLLPAETRFDNQIYVSCAELISSVPSKEKIELIGFASGELIIDASLMPATVHYFDMNGRLVYTDESNSTRMQMPELSNGIYVVQVVGRKEIHNTKVLITP